MVWRRSACFVVLWVILYGAARFMVWLERLDGRECNRTETLRAIDAEIAASEEFPRHARVGIGKEV